MNYTLYTQNFCKACDQIIDHLQLVGLEFEVVNIDETPKACPEDLFIIPALYKQLELKAYGKDIIRVFNV
ncbi:hypothetical protein N9V83_04125 [Flavobacteriales bacterium]|jgi:hypothetical protein|nr:hypothetical protein [Flavobacteriales bacterium]